MRVENEGARVEMLPLDAVQPNPHQPRQRFDSVRLDELASSLREHGVLQPILVHRLDDGRYELVAGERRWQAARRAGLAAIPALVVEASPRRVLELALVENLQRADLMPLEEAEAYRGLMAALGLTQEKLAERLGVSRVAVTNKLRLLSLAPAARDALMDGAISEGHARALLGIPRELQEQALRTVQAGALSVRQTERLARRLATAEGTGRVRTRSEDDESTTTAVLEERMRRAIGTRVRVRRRRDGSMIVLMQFHSADAAYQVIDLLAPDDNDDL